MAIKMTAEGVDPMILDMDPDEPFAPHRNGDPDGYGKGGLPLPPPAARIPPPPAAKRQPKATGGRESLLADIAKRRVD